MCSAVFVTGLDPAFAAENVGYFSAPYAERARLGTPKIDRVKRTVEITMPNGTVRMAKQVGNQGCVTKVQQAVEAAFDPAGMTAAFVVTYKGKIIAERYGEHITSTTPLESWSMGKSLTATLLGVLINQGAYDLWQMAPIPEWQDAR